MDIDWTKPLELEDGTPVVLAERRGRAFGGTNPDCDGDYWVKRVDGRFFDNIGPMRCVAPNGANNGVPCVRNRRRRSIPWQKLLWLTVFGSLIISGGWLIGTHIASGTTAGFIVADLLVLIAASGAFALTLFGED